MPAKVRSASAVSVSWILPPRRMGVSLSIAVGNP